jgi:hypothetical protein
MAVTAPSPSPSGLGPTKPRRRRANRPPTVPLAEFGKEPPPPPLITDWGAVARGIVLALVLLAVVWVGVVKITAASESYWRGANYLDQRSER